MLVPKSLCFALLAAVPCVQAIDDNYWIATDCYVADVTVNGKYVDQNRGLKYDWQLTEQTCKNNYASEANYDMGSGRCVSVGPNGLNGPQWWKNCQQQALNGWYDIDRSTGDIVVAHAPYKSNHAEGRGYSA
ncbi:hypothetical protein BDP81DRAFT_449458 [Colletotrichum phormii]|uniref:Secreted protein n=1 Tax=Colletotrichum phormii TaxID=359342 RepID=A0AAI9ZSK6_9PEZI|nr:uncharacterized protein BDP81DRAFT_449458 [Colletotrichum phormii]KAK1637437.1 hypothetical protein BDP81DRAFT_449458 [Colletotrichum phormii]